MLGLGLRQDRRLDAVGVFVLEPQVAPAQLQIVLHGRGDGVVLRNHFLQRALVFLQVIVVFFVGLGGLGLDGRRFGRLQLELGHQLVQRFTLDQRDAAVRQHLHHLHLVALVGRLALQRLLAAQLQHAAGFFADAFGHVDKRFIAVSPGGDRFFVTRDALQMGHR